MKFDLIVRDASVVRSSGVAIEDIGILDGKFAAFGAEVGGSSSEEVDASGLHLMPGLIDTQVHFREPGLTHKEDIGTGTRSAISGGVTAIFEMPNTAPPTTNSERLQEKLEIASRTAWCDYSFFMGATASNVRQLREYEQLPGSPGIKIFVGSSTGDLLVEEDEILLEIFRNGERPCSIHSEDEARLRARKALAGPDPKVADHHYLRDAEAAVLSTNRVISHCRESKRPIHILHISTGDEVPIIAAAKAEGLPVTAEVTPQHLFFSAPGCYEELGTLAQMNPPLREEYHRRRLWQGLRDGVFDIFGSDHAPHTLEEKALPFFSGSPSGMPGVQTLLQVLLSFVAEGALSLEDIAKMGAESPAQLFGIKNQGFIELGQDANFSLLDLTRTSTFTRDSVRSKCGWSPYEGKQLPNPPLKVFLRGRLAAEAGHEVGTPAGEPVRFAWK